MTSLRASNKHVEIRERQLNTGPHKNDKCPYSRNPLEE